MPTPLSICMISDDFLPAATGVGVHIKLIGKELAKRGHRVSVITSRRPGEPETEQWEGVTIFRCFTLKVYGFYQALPSRTTLRHLFNQIKPNIVHHHYLGFMMMRACAVAEMMQLPQVSTYHFSAEVLTQPLPMLPLRPLIRRQIIAFNNRFNLVIAPSHNLAEQLATQGIRTPVRYISNPVAFDDTAEVTPAPRGPEFTILYAGRLGPEKNLPYLLQAIKIATEQYPAMTLWIAGRGPEREAIERKIAELGLGERVQFLGFLDHATLARHYVACDLFVLPSLVEAQPLVAMEAMWFSKPVIVTRAIVAATEMVDEDSNGYIVDPGDPGDLAAKLVKLAAAPQLRARMGAAGREKAQHYQPDQVVDAIEQAYRDVLAAP